MHGQHCKSRINNAGKLRAQSLQHAERQWPSTFVKFPICSLFVSWFNCCVTFQKNHRFQMFWICQLCRSSYVSGFSIFSEISDVQSEVCRKSCINIAGSLRVQRLQHGAIAPARRPVEAILKANHWAGATICGCSGARRASRRGTPPRRLSPLPSFSERLSPVAERPSPVVCVLKRLASSSEHLSPVVETSAWRRSFFLARAELRDAILHGAEHPTTWGDVLVADTCLFL